MNSRILAVYCFWFSVIAAEIEIIRQYDEAAEQCA